MARLGPIAALLLAALPMALAQAGGRPGVPVYCWQATSEIKVTSEDARQVCAELWVTSPRGNPISNYWETTVLVEGLELDNNTVTNIWMIDTITPGAALWTYKMRSWDQLRPGVPYRAMSFCGSVTLNNHGFTTVSRATQ